MGTINRFSSRRQRLDHAFLANRLKGAKSYKRIAGYCSSSILEVAGEALGAMSGPVRVVCNSDLHPRDVKTAKAVNAALRPRPLCTTARFAALGELKQAQHTIDKVPQQYPFHLKYHRITKTP